MNNPLSPRIHIEVFANQSGNITIKTIETKNDRTIEDLVAIAPSQVDDLIQALQAVKLEIENN